MVCPSPNFVTNGAAYLNSSTVVTESGNCCFTLFTDLNHSLWLHTENISGWTSLRV